MRVLKQCKIKRKKISQLSTKKYTHISNQNSRFWITCRTDLDTHNPFPSKAKEKETTTHQQEACWQFYLENCVFFSDFGKTIVNVIGVKVKPSERWNWQLNRSQCGRNRNPRSSSTSSLKFNNQKKYQRAMRTKTSC